MRDHQTLKLYSTYLGGSSAENDNSIAVDERGRAYVTGATRSTDFPTTPGAFQETPGGNSDAFVAKIGEDGNCTGARLKHGACSGGY